MQRFIATVLLVLSGCVGQLGGSAATPDWDRSTNLSANEFALQRDGEDLRIDGTPIDPSYVALYPNPEGVESMLVSIQEDGTVRPQCSNELGSIACSSTPFVTLAVRAETETTIKVWDVFGELVAVLEFDVERTEEARASDPGGDRGPGQEQDGAQDTQGPRSGDGPGEADVTPDSNGTQGNGCDFNSIGQQVCDRVNGQLMDYTLDCSTLDGVFGETPDEWEAVVEGLFGGGNSDVAFTTCEDLIYGEGREFQNDVLGRCPAAGADLNNLFHDARVTLMEVGQCRGSPLVLDLDGDGIRASSLDRGVTFDLFGINARVDCAWLEGSDDAFLAHDNDGDGVIDSGAELFGNGSQGGPFDDGFEALLRFDSNRDGWVDPLDAEFAELVLWTDHDRDGRGLPGELEDLASAGIMALALAPSTVSGGGLDDHGNAMPLVSQFVRSDGTSGPLVDVFFRFRLRSQ